jgi:hypothetical protein
MLRMGDFLVLDDASSPATLLEQPTATLSLGLTRRSAGVVRLCIEMSTSRKKESQ